MPRKKAKATDAIAIIHRRHYAHRPERETSLQEARANAEIARKIYDLRKAAGLTQRALAHLVGTTASVICRLEDADYEGHSLAMLQRIAAALNKRAKFASFPARPPFTPPETILLRVRLGWGLPICQSGPILRRFVAGPQLACSGEGVRDQQRAT